MIIKMVGFDLISRELPGIFLYSINKTNLMIKWIRMGLNDQKIIYYITAFVCVQLTAKSNKQMTYLIN